MPTRECIVVPREVIDGLITALHIQLDNPPCHQLKLVTFRHFYALDMDKCIEQATNSCHQCSSLSKVPHTLAKQSTSDPPDAVGVSFAADVMKRERQLIFVIRECVTSYTTGCIIEDERSETLRSALIRMCIELKPLDGPSAVVRVDPAPGFSSLSNDKLLSHYGLSLEIGRFKNCNKNPVAERAIQEIQHELLSQDPVGGSVTSLTLSVAIARLNSRIRGREMWVQRDQFSNAQIPFSDTNLIQEQQQQRLINHPYSEASKTPSKKMPTTPQIDVGDLVYLHNDRNKSRARNRYLVVSVEQLWCNIRKFGGSQLRSTSYRVKLSDCYKVPNQLVESHAYRNNHHQQHSSEEESDLRSEGESYLRNQELPNIPPEISSPAAIVPFIERPSHHAENSPETGDVNNTQEEDTILTRIPAETSAPMLGDPPRRSTRIKHQPAKFKDYHME